LALEDYLVERCKLATTDDHVFVSMWHRRMCRQAVYNTFIELLKAADLPRQSGMPRPRLIDFRHYSEFWIIPSALSLRGITY
jgi:hypothetical protein